MPGRVYGWIRDKPDSSDVRFSIRRLGLRSQPLPPHVDLRLTCPPVYDQEDLGSCTAQAIGAAIQFDEIKLRKPHEQPSALFIYWNERAVMGTTHVDSGAAIRDGMRVVNELGHCETNHWPYDVSKYTEKPPPECYQYAIDRKCLVYESVAHDLHSVKECLAAGFPMIFGFMVHASFESNEVADGGFVPMPGPHDPARGGHAALAIGYDDATGLFLVRNSWGPEWGAQGNFLFPYAYMMAPDTCDFWALRITQHESP
jgi:C1A family cysteine protease